MLRGWSSLNVSGPITAPILGALLITGVCLNSSDATELDAAEFASDVRGQALAVTTAPFPVIAHVFDNGVIEVQSAIGTWQGAWATAGETMCLFFDAGPKVGENCVTIQRTADGSYQTSDGTELRPVASALRF